MSKVHTGPHGGKYVVKGGKKKYLKPKAKARNGNVLKGKGAYGYGRQQRVFGPPMQPRVRGKGGFFSDLGGGVDKVADMVGKIVGLGDYQGMKLVKNTLMGMDVGGSSAGVLPTVSNATNRFIVTHKEFLGDVTSNGPAFSLDSLKINPGLTETFPWLSNIAANFEQWKPLGIVFQYKTTSVDSLTTANVSLGSVMMATDYNSANANFASKEQMDNTTYVSSTKPSASCLHPIECSPKETPTPILYVRQGGIGSGQDPRLYDLGNFQIATVGQQSGQAGSVIGELWVTYQIELLKPILTSIGLGEPQFAHWVGKASNTGGTDEKNLFDFVSPASLAFNNTSIQVQASNGTGGTIFDLTPVPGTRLMIQCLYNGTPGHVEQPTATLTGGTPADIYLDQSQPNAPVWNLGGTLPTQGQLMFCYVFDVDSIGTPWSVSFNASGTLPTPIDEADLIIMQLAVENNVPGPLELAKMGPIKLSKYNKTKHSLSIVETKLDDEKALLHLVGDETKLKELIAEDLVANNPGMTKLQAYKHLMATAKDEKSRVKKVEEPSPKETEYVDLSASQLLVKAIEKAAKK